MIINNILVSEQLKNHYEEKTEMIHYISDAECCIIVEILNIYKLNYLKSNKCLLT